MIIHDVEQKTNEWFALRAGKPTASDFHKIFTPGGKLSKQACSYMYHLLAERIVGHAILTEATEWMERGAGMEEQAVKAYEFIRDVETRVIGFISTDDGRIGCSPDRLVDPDRILEIKCPKHTTHVCYMLTNCSDTDYFPQLQGMLWLTGRSAVDIVSYYPEMRSVVITVERDDNYIALLEEAVLAFAETMDVHYKILEDKYGPFERHVIEPPPATPFDVTVEDVERVWNASLARQATEVK